MSRFVTLCLIIQHTAWRLDEGNDVIRPLKDFAPEMKNFFWGGGQIGVHRMDTYIDRFADLKFLCITGLELRSVERKYPTLLFNKL